MARLYNLYYIHIVLYIISNREIISGVAEDVFTLYGNEMPISVRDLNIGVLSTG